MRRLLALLMAAISALVLPAAALAHGVHGEAQTIRYLARRPVVHATPG